MPRPIPRSAVIHAPGPLARSLLSVALAALSFQAAAQTAVEIGFRLTHTDNVDLVENDETSDLLRAPYIGFAWNEERKSIDAAIDGRFAYEDYRKDTTEDDTVGELSARVDWRVIEDRLIMRFEDRFEQVRFDELDPLAPDNTEDANTFVLGPDLFFDVTPVDRLTFGARYGETTFERSTDSERWAAGATWSHRLSTINELLVRAERQEVRFTEEDPLAVDYVIDEIAGGWVRRLARGEVRTVLGYRGFDPEEGDTLDRGFAVVDWTYTPTRRSTLDVRFESGLTNAGDRLLDRNRPTVRLPSPDAFVSNDIVELSQLQARLERTGGRFDIVAGARATEEDFNISNLDAESYGATLELGYPLTPRDQIVWAGGFARTDYVLIGRTDDDYSTTLRLRHRLGPKLFVEGGYAYLERDSSAAFNSYNENRIFVAAGYRWGE